MLLDYIHEIPEMVDNKAWRHGDALIHSGQIGDVT